MATVTVLLVSLALKSMACRLSAAKSEPPSAEPFDVDTYTVEAEPLALREMVKVTLPPSVAAVAALLAFDVSV